MDALVRFSLHFIVMFVVFNLVYLLIVNKRKKDYSKLKKNDPVKIFIARYNLDMRKTDYSKLLKIVGVVNSFIISFTAALILNVNGFMYKLLITFATVFVFMYALYDLLGKYLKKREDKK